MNKENTCCFTGHRQLPKDKMQQILNKSEAEIIAQIKKVKTSFITGGAVGFDMLCAEIIIQLKKQYPINLIIAVPCQNQEKSFSPTDKIRYTKVLSMADEVVYVSQKYFSGCMYKRNRYMVDNSSCLISYCSKMSGGSYYTKSYAYDNGIEIIEIS